VSVSPIVSRFRQIVGQYPNAVAIRSGTASLTYTELDQAARRLQQRLEQLSLQPGEVVGTCLDRGIDLVVAQLAILAVGCICLPVDPSAPVEASSQNLRTTRVRWLIGKPTHHEQWRNEFGWIDPDLTYTGSAEELLDGYRRGSSAIGFILFTSGSTGVPKGVCIRQDSVIHLV